MGGIEPNGQPEAGPARQGLWQRLFEALVAYLNFLRPQKDIGVENRFYYDEDAKEWKLRGGETDRERDEWERLSHHVTGVHPSQTAAHIPPPPRDEYVVKSLLGSKSATVVQTEPNAVVPSTDPFAPTKLFVQTNPFGLRAEARTPAVTTDPFGGNVGGQ